MAATTESLNLSALMNRQEMKPDTIDVIAADGKWIFRLHAGGEEFKREFKI